MGKIKGEFKTKGFHYDGDELKHSPVTRQDPVTGKIVTTEFDRVDVAVLRCKQVVESHIRRMTTAERERFVDELFDVVLHWKREK